jgi:uncharacterized membrane protein YjjP (DUF1212 family)
VNETLYRSLLATASEVECGRFTASRAKTELDRLVHNTPQHPDWAVALAVGVACAAFGRLLDVDWVAVGPIFATAALGQMVRRQLALHSVNVFLSTAVVAFLTSSLCGIGSRWVGSQTVARDMIASVLLLVPGVPSFNAQLDILEGRPTVGSARAIWVAVTLVFMAVGIWFARGLLGEGR